MKILYVAKHDSGGNDDEGAIAYALRKLGHEVVCIPESAGNNAYSLGGDLLLFHKWDGGRCLPLYKKMPRVFWYFDLVRSPGNDISLIGRDRGRIAWMEKTLPKVELGFCTDGDWVKYMRDGWGETKVYWLPQGADERVVGRGVPKALPNSPRILFAGIGNRGGAQRVSFVEEMKRVYGDLFLHIPHGVYGRDLADVIASVDIVVAPDYPVTDRYWSNRIYTMLGFGAFLLHPVSKGALGHYHHLLEMVAYESRTELHALINKYINSSYGARAPQDRLQCSQAALDRTKREHLYRHRCEMLLSAVKRWA